jgi:type IV pilus biogenesis/stability protein PilW
MKKIWLVGASCMVLLSVMIACTTKENLEKQKAQAEASRNLGEAYLREGKYSAALRELAKAEALTPDDYFLQFDLGLAYLYKDQPDKAIDHFKKSLAIKGDYGPARNNLGNAYAAKKQWDKAIEQYEIVISNLLYVTPQFPYSNLGFAYYYKKEYERSERYFKKALDITPDFARALYGLAKTYIDSGRIAQGLETLEFAVEKHPDNALLHFELAETYVLTRDYSRAYGSYIRVVQIDPDSQLADKALKAARRIKPLL